MADRIVIYVTSGLQGTSISKSNLPYVVVDQATLTVIASDDKKLIGTKWEPPPQPPKGMTPSGGIPRPPIPIELALWISTQEGNPYFGKTRFSHETVYATLPAGVSISAEQKPEYGDIFWYVWAMTFGSTINSLVSIRHWHNPMMKVHDDPLYTSIIQFVYPLNLKVSRERPHYLILRNDDTTPQVAESTIWFVETDKESATLIDKLFIGYMNHYLKEAK